MRVLMISLFGLYFSIALTALASADDVGHSPSCSHCGMDRGKFNRSRMIIEFEDGSTLAVCSLHCAAAELASSAEMPVAIRVADYETTELIDAENAVWVLGGSKKGVMTAQPKWAFANRKEAEGFVKEYGGSIVGFDSALKAAYEDMYEDTRMILEFRELKRLTQSSAVSHP